MAAKPRMVGEKEVLASLLKKFADAALPAPPTKEEQKDQGRHRRFMEKAIFDLVAGVVVLAVIGCLVVIADPGSSAVLKDHAIGVLGGAISSVIAAGFGFLAGRGTKTGEG